MQEVLHSFVAYENSELFVSADMCYLINSAAYLLCALRDCELLWFMPVAGRFPNFDALACAHYLSVCGGNGGVGGRIANGDDLWLLDPHRDKEKDNRGREGGIQTDNGALNVDDE